MSDDARPRRERCPTCRGTRRILVRLAWGQYVYEPCGLCRGAGSVEVLPERPSISDHFEEAPAP